MKFQIKNFKLTYIVLIIICCYCFISCRYWKFWHDKEEPFISDSAISYWYVPATFVYNDYKVIHPKNSTVLPDSEGKLIPKYTYGMSVMYTPFFFAGKAIAKIKGEDLGGYSKSFGFAIKYGCIIYGLLGLLFLSFILLHYFSDKVSSITLFLIFFASNLMVYLVKESERVHCSLFFLISLFIWLSIKWHHNPGFKKSTLLGLVLGLITMIRPTDLIIILFFFLFGVNNFSSFKSKLIYFLINRKLLLVFFAGFTIVIIPQLVFWKNFSGDWLHYGYGDEKFFWTQPKLFKMLFSLRNGWFVYSPIMLFAFIGLIFLNKQKPDLFLPCICFVLLNLYVLSSWWCWWYMGFGLRAVVQSYPIMAMGLASLLTKLNYLRPHILNAGGKFLISLLFAFFIFLNFTQSIQYRDWLLSGDGMTKKMYRKSFCKLSWTEEEKKDARNSFPKINMQSAVNGKR